ncbi:MAG: ATP-binding protein [Anaerolineae bacterium]|nr:ATP-binding protein [Anaerolineae bacterium]MDW7992722.1 ATP-binding protein [Anaerolineae bacterium]
MLGPLYNLLTTGPGTFVYHLLILLALEGAAGIAFTEYRRTRNPDQRRFLIAFSLLVLLRIPLLVLGPQHHALLAPLLYALEVASLTIMAWAFLTPVIGRRAGWLFVLVSLLIASGLTLLFFPLWYQMVQAVPFMEYAVFWQQAIWDLWAFLIALGTGIYLLTQTRRNGDPLTGVAFLIIALGNLFIALDQPGLGRIVNLLGYPLISVIVYRAALQDLWAYRQELQTLSERSVRQMQELFSLLEIGRILGESLDLEQTLKRVAENIAHALDADRVAILLRDSSGEEEPQREPDRLRIRVLYAPLLGHLEPPGEEVLPADHPLLAHAVGRRRGLSLNPRETVGHLASFYALLGIQRGGPTLLQPLVYRDQVVGVLVVVSEHSRIPFESRSVRICESIAAQIAAAVENVGLYHRLEQKVEDLDHALQEQQKEASLREAILESAAEGIIVTDREGRAIRMNAAAEKILGVSRERLLGRSVQGILTQATLPDLDDMARLTSPLEALFEMEGKQVAISAAPVRLLSGETVGFIALLRDVTREVQAESAKREFIATVSHELRTPLTAILGYSEALYSGMVGSLTPTQSTFVRIIHENARRLVAIANNLIAMAEAEQGRLRLNYIPTDLALLAAEVVETFIPRMKERQLEWRLEIADDLPLVEVDPVRIRQVLTNLVSNAVKFTYPGGRITVGVATVPEPDGGSPQFCRIWVQDTGIGIPLEEQSRIWERFYRSEDPLRAEAGGLGLGLSIVRTLVDAHGGRIWLESAPGKGSTFTILLPLCRPVPPSPQVDEDVYPTIERALGL